jgi:hypothetical protein
MMRGVLDVSAPFLLIAAADIALGAVLLAVGGAWTGVIAYGLLGLACVPLLIVCAVLISGIASRLGSHHRLSA